MGERRTLRAVVLDHVGVLTDPDADRLYAALVALRARGMRTALLSNASGVSTVVRKELGEHFDAAVFSGEVGVGKPAREVYLLTAERLGLPADACVFVDDAPANVRGAAAAGMVGVHHTSVTETLAELAALLPEHAAALATC